jgi:CBS domain-containing protein/RimJ/RimL family protein N-acetyltransferase
MAIDLSDTTIQNFPHAFINRRGEPILIKPLDEKRREHLGAMYLAFCPRGCFSGLPPIDDDACTRWVRTMIATGANLIALSFGEGVVGHSALFPTDGDTCELMCAVSPPSQRAGIGTELTRCAIHLADELGFETIKLHVEARNHVAIHVYEKTGFQRDSRDLRDELDMSLDLRRYRRTAELAVGEIMNRRVVTVTPETPCQTALSLFLEDRVATLPVVNDRKQVVGILSETDLMVEANVRKKARDVLTREVVTVHEHATIAKVIALFRSRKLRCIPVVNNRRELVGIVGRKEVLSRYLKSP